MFVDVIQLSHLIKPIKPTQETLSYSNKNHKPIEETFTFLSLCVHARACKARDEFLEEKVWGKAQILGPMLTMRQILASDVYNAHDICLAQVMLTISVALHDISGSYILIF